MSRRAPFPQRNLRRATRAVAGCRKEATAHKIANAPRKKTICCLPRSPRFSHLASVFTGAFAAATHKRPARGCPHWPPRARRRATGLAPSAKPTCAASSSCYHQDSHILRSRRRLLSPSRTSPPLLPCSRLPAGRHAAGDRHARRVTVVKMFVGAPRGASGGVAARVVQGLPKRACCAPIITGRRAAAAGRLALRGVAQTAAQKPRVDLGQLYTSQVYTPPEAQPALVRPVVISGASQF
eukprot:109330-Chlamydomonas_euryale.AAC.3